MHCDDIDLIRCLDRGLTPEEEVHLKSCQACQRELRALSEARSLLLGYFRTKKEGHLSPDEITGLALGEDAPWLEVSARHAEGCAKCSELVALVKKFKIGFVDEPVDSRIKLPEPLRLKIIERRRLHLINNFKSMLSKTTVKELNKISAYVDKLLAPEPEPLAMAAAAEDLTRVGQKPIKAPKRRAKKKTAKTPKGNNPARKKPSCPATARGSSRKSPGKKK